MDLNVDVNVDVNEVVDLRRGKGRCSRFNALKDEISSKQHRDSKP